ncbi:MAG: hypothetical protein MI799_02675 [Desulfobacterales bacterium]|nr:hypothetical protein [Desulfobacterales bacterium]
MEKRRNAVFLILFTALAVLVFNDALAGPLRSTLEASWYAHLKASRSGKESELKKTMSAYSFCTLKNSLVSAQRSLTPDIITSISKYAPDISQMRFVRILENAETAALVYAMDSEKKDADGNPGVTFNVVKFVKEASGWKVDASMNCDKPKYRIDGKESTFYKSDLRPACAMDGKAKPAPLLLPKPYSTALLDIFSYGYQTVVSVNGVRQSPVSASWSGVLLGGLSKGKNKVSITITKRPSEKQLPPKIRIRRILKNRTTQDALKFEPKRNIEGDHTFVVTVK